MGTRLNNGPNYNVVIYCIVAFATTQAGVFCDTLLHNGEQCGRSIPPEQAECGARRTLADPRASPWTVLVQTVDWAGSQYGTPWRCAGVLLDVRPRRWVMASAAACVPLRSAVSPCQPDQFKVTIFEDGYEWRYSVTHHVDTIVVDSKKNIALFRISSAHQYSSPTEPVCFSSYDLTLSPGDYAHVASIGSADRGMHETLMKVVSREFCEASPNGEGNSFCIGCYSCATSEDVVFASGDMVTVRTYPGDVSLLVGLLSEVRSLHTARDPVAASLLGEVALAGVEAQQFGTICSAFNVTLLTEEHWRWIQTTVQTAETGYTGPSCGPVATDLRNFGIPSPAEDTNDTSAFSSQPSSISQLSSTLPL